MRVNTYIEPYRLKTFVEKFSEVGKLFFLRDFVTAFNLKIFGFFFILSR